MKMMSFCTSSIGASVILALLCSIALSPASATDASGKRAKNPLALPKVPDVAIPQSVFTVPSQPEEGHNPFFPQSTIKVLPPTKVNRDPLDTSSIVLNGITSPPKRTAMINGRTFETGEEAEVRLATGGKLLIKVEEIKNESAIILVGGQRRELRLRAGV